MLDLYGLINISLHIIDSG